MAEAMPLPGLPGELYEKIERAQQATLARQRERATVAQQSPTRPRSPDVVARLLAERGFWALSPSEQTSEYEVEDLRGFLHVLPTMLGAPGVADAMVFSGLLSLWACGARDSPTVATSLHGLAEQICMPWCGDTSDQLRRSLEILKATSYRVTVQDDSGKTVWSQLFSLLDEVTVWDGPATSPRRQIEVTLSNEVMRQLADRRNIQPVDLAGLRALGPRRELARRLLLFLEALPAHQEPYGLERARRIIDHRMAGSLGSKAPAFKLVQGLRRAAAAIAEHSPRYVEVAVLPRAARNLTPGEAKYLIEAVRVQRSSTRNKP